MSSQGNNRAVRREIVLDVETTGLEPDGPKPDRIIEIGAVELIDWKNGREFYRLVNPNVKEIAIEITELTGHTIEKLKDCPKFDDPSIVEDLLEFIGEATIIAHNASFDWSFLNAELGRAEKSVIPFDRWFDTLREAKNQHPKLKTYTLNALCDHYEIPRTSREKHHGALIDALLTADVYKGLKDKLPPRGLDLEMGKEEMITVSSQQSYTRTQPIRSLRREIVLDVDTTGLEHDGDNPDRIIQIGAVELIDWTHGREFHRLVNPKGKEISETITKISGLTREKLEDYPEFDDPSVVEELLEFIGEAKIVAHNATFDQSFINAELGRANKEIIPDDRWIDMMELARKKFPSGRNSLDKLCERFKISRAERKQRHGGLIDSRILVKVYQGLNNRLAQELGLETRDELEIISSGLTDRRLQPIKSLRNDQERIAHHDFLQETFKGDCIWRFYQQ